MAEHSLMLDITKWTLGKQFSQTLVLDAKDPIGKWLCLGKKSF